MLYYDNEWKICPFVAHYKAHGKPDFKYTNDKKWWIEFVNKWWHHTDLSFTDVNPTEAQQTRLDEINTANIPEGFGHGASMYVESGLIVDTENPHFAGFENWPGALDNEKTKLRAEVDVIRDQHIFTLIPYTFPGDTEPDAIQLRDHRDRQNIQTNSDKALLLLINGDTTTLIPFMPLSNNVKMLNATQMTDMSDFLKIRGDGIYTAAWTKKGEINATTTLEELKAIDLNTGWPED